MNFRIILLLIFICGITCLQSPILTPQKIVEIGNGINKLLHFGNDLEMSKHWSIDEVSKMVIRGLSNDFLELKYRLMNKSSTTLSNKLANKMDEFIEYTNSVENFYKTFVYIYINIYTKLDQSERRLKDFSIKFLLDNLEHLETSLKRMDEILVGSDVEGENIAMIISKSSPSDIMGVDGGSSQQIIHKLYTMSVLTHTKGLLLVLYALDVKERFENVDLESNKQEEINKYYSRIHSTFEKVKRAMGNASRELWKFDPAEHIRVGAGMTFLELGPIFQGFLIPDVDIYNNSLITSCNSFSGMNLICESESCKSEIEDKKCRGVLRNCQSTDSIVHVCYSTDLGRRYNWMKTKEGIMYGLETKSCWRFETQRSSRSFGNCQCTCESGHRLENRYFSLLDVVANIDQNKVVTGAKIVKYSHIFYIQIQQGILGKNGTIIDRTAEWKPVDTNEKNHLLTDYVATAHTRPSNLVDWKDNDLVYTVREGRNTVYLDDLEGQKNELVTGLRFVQDGSGLKLAIQLTHFNYSTGQLYQNRSSWISASVDNREELVLTEPDMPINAPKKSDTFSQNNQYVRFRMSDFKTDLGQNTIPFIDSQPIMTNPPSPLAGAGIFHKGTKHYGGFLALKLIHSDFTDHF